MNEIRNFTLGLALLAGVGGPALATLPPASPQAKAQAEEGKAKASRNAPKHGLCAMGRKSGGHGVIAVGSLS